MELRPRTRDTLSKCLQNSGMEYSKAYALLADTHGLYAQIKKRLFRGEYLKQPSWVSGVGEKAQKTCLLIGSWEEIDGDKLIIESLYGDSYDHFIDEVLPYAKGEDPLLYMINRNGSVSYYLASTENIWSYLNVLPNEPIWQSFIKALLDVINEAESLFTYDHQEALVARFKGERLFWSETIRKGMLKTLLIKGAYQKDEETQQVLDALICKILDCVKTEKQWIYITKFWRELCEISPKATLDRLEREINEGTGLLSLFQNQSSDILLGRNAYIDVLWGVEQFLTQRDFFWSALRWLLKLDSYQYEYKSNNPKDASVLYDENQDYPWYLMPKAMRFNPQRCYPSKIIEHMIHIGESLKQLHSLGYAHRDIKPNNLLYYQGHMYLADFGLVWNAKDTEDHITEVNDHLGPIVIRPPELQLIEDIESVDYRKSDVYLFAKTLWMLLEHDSIGFLSEYSRSDENVYIYKNTEKHKLETAEPLHRLMEGATKHNWGERITIDDCLFYLEEQLSIITETIPQNKLQEYKYIEQVKHIDATFHPDRKEFSDPSAILRTLNEMSGLACLEFNKAGTTTGRILFSKASYIQGGVFEMEIRYPYYYGKKKTIELAIDCIFLDKDLNFEIRSKTYSFEDELFPQYTQIITALESQAKRVRLNAEYSIRMVQL